MAAPDVNEECDICCEDLKEPRVLDCDHIFCLNCLEKLERRKRITCPICKETTDIPPGMYVTHLPVYVVGKPDKSKVQLIKKIEIRHQIVSMVVDTAAKLIYAGLDSEDTPIVVYSFTGKHRGALSRNPRLCLARLGIDTKRGLILATDVATVCQINKRGLEVGTIACPEFRYIKNIAYHAGRDLYLVADSGAGGVFFVAPDSSAVVRRVEVMSRGQWAACGNVRLCSDHTGNHGSTWGITASDNNLIAVYDMDGASVRTYKTRGGGHGQINRPGGVYMDKRGRLTVSDRGNERIVRLDPSLSRRGGGEWELVVNTKQLGLGNPRDLHVTEDGLAVVVLWDLSVKGVFHIGVFSGFP